MPSSFFRFFASAGEMTWSFSSRRLRVEDLCSNLCWLLACSRMSLPVPVTRTRFTVPLWVFCFGMFPSSSSWCRAARQHGAAARPRDACGRGVRTASGAGRLLLRGGLGGSRIALRVAATLRGRGALVRGDDHDHVPAVLLGVGLDDAELPDVGGQPLEQPVAHLRPRLLAAAEHDRDLDLVALLQEAL